MTQAPRILIVEDDPVINQALTDRLLAEGFAVSRAFDGPGAVERFETDRPDAAVLDVMLPGFDGLEVCRRIQAISPTPVLMLTARDEESDILTGLAVGADDYLTKPFRIKEVVARVRALLRRVDRAAELARGSGRGSDFGVLRIDQPARRVLVRDTEVRLTPTEFDLLARLAQEPGVVVPRERLLVEVWDWPESLARAGSRTLDSHIRALRAKIGPEFVRTAHGVGFALEVSDE